MQHILPTRPRLLSALLVLLLALLVRPAHATHLLGGELTYRYLDSDGPDAAPHRYEVTLEIYLNCPTVTLTADPVSIALYDLATGAKLNLTALNYYSVQSGNLYITNTAPGYSITGCITPPVPAGCNISGPSQPYRLQRFVATVNLPTAPQGYYAVFYQGNRNVDITNIANSTSTNMGLYTTMAPPSVPNRSPVFANRAVAIICASDTTFYLNNAIDADGDRLTYTFGTPYNILSFPTTFAGSPTGVPYVAGGYSATSPFGTGTGIVSQLNSLTGIAQLATPNTGKYVIAVDVREYRTIAGVERLIGITRRDVQLAVAQCPSTPAPKVPTPAAGLLRNYTVIAGSSQRIPITATQADNHALTLTVTSELLDGPGGYSATLNGNPGTTAGLTGTVTASVPAGTTAGVSGDFQYTAGCNDVRTTPYDIVVSVKDEGCAGKTVYDVFRVTVVAPTGPTALTGDELVCGTGLTRTYTASGGTATKVNWTVTGGTIQQGQGTSTITVLWNTVGQGSVKAQGASAGNCPAATLTKNVSVQAVPTLTATGSRAVCAGSSSTITVTGGTTGTTYAVTGGPVTGTSPTFVLTPTATTTYTITSTPPAGGCPSTTQVTVTVNPLPAANAGLTPRATCSGAPITLGAAPVAGNTYSWSPATGLSSTTVANPTFTLTNTTNAPITQTYTLTETTPAGCSVTNSVVVTTNPAVVAVPGTAVAICSGGTAQLGAAPVAGLTYQWSPADNLSSATVANPTFTLTNTTNAPIVRTYTLTTTNPTTGCVGTATVVVTTNPAVVAVPGAAVAICSGGTAQLGAAPVAGLTYQWSPATGLSSTTAANPTFTLTNTTNAPIVQTYTLTATNPVTGCSGTATVVVTTNPAVTAVPGRAVAICSGGTAQLGAAPVAGVTYQWSPSTGLSSATVANPTFTLTNTTNAPIVQTYTLTATNAQGCTNTATVVVTTNPAVVANVGPAKTTIGGQGVQIGADPVAGFSYSWSPATGLSSTSVANPTVLLTNYTGASFTQTYTLTTTNIATGCSNTASVVVTINVDTTLEIYNIVTPNNDGMNDYLFVKNVRSFPGNTLEVYNRWGRQVFNTTNYDTSNNHWGDDSNVAPGVYYYLFKQANGSVTKGWVEVVR